MKKKKEKKLVEREINKRYSDQVKFNNDPENDKWKKAHSKVFMDI